MLLPVWSIIRESITKTGRCALATVIEIEGAAPQAVGSRMIVLSDGAVHGTIGGGNLEWRVISHARRQIERDGPSRDAVRHAIVFEGDRDAAGTVVVSIEVHDESTLDSVKALRKAERTGVFATVSKRSAKGVERQIVPLAGSEVSGGPALVIREDSTYVERFGNSFRSVYLFGAGHVGRAVVAALGPLPFEVTWVDERPNAFPTALQANTRALVSPDAVQELARAPDDAFVVIMTHSVALDYDLTFAALYAERFGYVGVIGSRAKRAQFVRRLRGSALSQRTIAPLVCPIGMDGITSKWPATIAASVAGELLLRDELLTRTEQEGR